MKFIRSFFIIGIITLFINSNVFAQQTGSLSGQVSDALGAIVVGANVIAVAADGREKTTTSNQRGEFTLSGLAPGTYAVRVSAPRFAFYENAAVEVKAGAAEDLNVVLTVEGVEEQVDVGGGNEVSTDPNSNASATVLTPEDLESLPDDPDELEAALQALAGPSAGPNGGQIYIDGFTGGRLPPRESIREIRINQNPFSAENDRLGFGRIEVLTKPGSDRWRGQAFFNFNDESLNSRNPFALNRAPSQTRFFGGNVSGPIQKGKSSFFLDISNRDITNASLVNATILDPSLNIIAFREEFTVPTKRFSINPRFDYQINTNNTLVARYGFQRNTSENQGISGFSLPTRAFETTNIEHNIQLTETMIINPRTVNETRFQYEFQNREQNGDNSIPTVNVSSAFTGGGAQVGTNFTRTNRWELQNYTTTSLGANSAHTVKFGARLRGISLKDRSEAGFGGTFNFAGIAERRIPNGCVPPQNSNDPPCTIIPAVSSIEQFRQRVLGNTDPQFNPSQFIITAGNPLADVSQVDLGAFVTDDWRVRPDLTLSFGLRYENQTNIKDSFNFAPRASFAWSPGAGGARQPKTVVRGGAGLFFDRFSENYILQSERFDGFQQQQYIIPSGSALLSQPVFSADGTVSNVPTAAQLAQFAPLTNTIRRVSDDLQSPYTIQFALGVERQLPLRTTLSAFFIGSRNVHVLRLRNVNAPVCGLSNACVSLTQAQIQALRPDPAQGNIYEYESTGFLNQRQLILNFNSRISPRFNLSGNYRLGWARGDAEGGGFFGGGGVAFPAYSYDLSGEYGRSSLGVRHNLFVRGSFTMPWRVTLSPFIIASSGVPFNITTGVDTNRDSLFAERPTFAQLFSECERRGLTNTFCDPNGISDPNAVIPRNYGRGPGSFNVNMNVSKTFGFGSSRETAASAGGASEQPSAQDGRQGGGRGGNRGGGRGGFGGGQGGGGGRGGFGGATDKPYNLTLGLQFINLFNRNNRGIPVGNLSSRLFGQSLSTGGAFGFFGGGGGSNSGNRRIELQTRFSW